MKTPCVHISGEDGYTPLVWIDDILKTVVSIAIKY